MFYLMLKNYAEISAVPNGLCSFFFSLSNSVYVLTVMAQTLYIVFQSLTPRVLFSSQT